MVVTGIVIYFLSNWPQIFQEFPQEKIVLPGAQPVATSRSSAPAVSSQTQISSQPPQIPDSSIPVGYTRAELSPYFQKVRIYSTYSSIYSGYPSQFQVNAYLPENQKVDITNWKIKTNHGEFFIPQAVNVYNFSGPLFQGDIIIPGNAKINISTNKSPINLNFRLNECTGYLQNSYSFNPALPQSCPSNSRPENIYLSGQCQSYISSLSSCKEPDISFYNSLPGNDEGNACRQFLSTINQNGCFQKHHNDANFLSNEWRIWINWDNRNNILDSQHDTVRLFDINGLLVDQYIY